MGVETNTNKFKFGNGTDTWTALAYAASDAAAIGEISQDAINQALSVGAGLTKTYDDGANTITVTVDTGVIATKTFAIAEASAAQTAAAAYTDTAVNGINSSLTGYLETGDRGVAGGVASLDSNTKIPEAQLKLDNLSANITTSGNVQAENVTVGGNLVVNGTTTTLNTQNFTVEDTLLYIGAENQSSQLDLGFVAAHNTGTYNHTGLVRDASDNKWKLFKDVTDEPTTTVNFAQASLDNLALHTLDATAINTNGITVTGSATLPAASITTANLTSTAVTEDKVAANAVSTTKIVDGAVTTAKIADSAITSAKIVDGTIVEGDLADAAVTTAKIANIAVTSDKLGDAAVITTKIADNAVTSGKIAANAISQSHLSDDSVGTAELGGLSVTTEKVADLAITTAKINDLAVTGAKIANLTIDATKIASASITDAQIAADAGILQSKIFGLSTSLGLLAAKDAPTFTGTVVLPGTTSIGSVSSTEIGYLDGITSSVQTQIDAAATALSTHESDTTNIHGIANTANLATASEVSTAMSEAILDAGTAADTKISTAVAALTKSSVGLANVDNTADADKPVSTAQASAIATAKSEAIADATTQVNAVIAAAPAALNTLDELAAALGDDANFASTVTTGLAAKAPIASPTFTGTVTVAADGVAFTDKVQTRAGVPSLTTIATAVSSNSTLDALGTDAAVRDSLVPLSGAVNVSFEATGNAKYAIGSSINFYQSSGTGANITGSGVTILATPGATLRTTNSSVTATKIAATTWLLAGDLKA
jgi:hypothetical protein